MITTHSLSHSLYNELLGIVQDTMYFVPHASCSYPDSVLVAAPLLVVPESSFDPSNAKVLPRLRMNSA